MATFIDVLTGLVMIVLIFVVLHFVTGVKS